ncbi:MAG: ribosomal protein L7/L12 [Lachnospiraceae bacterium]|nr:ribosomal protein L7/L12 [Lachnospiraceae bacterium]
MEALTDERKEALFSEFKDIMTGSLAALYKKTHEEKYSEEYMRRLCRIGFSEAQAKNLFLFEVMILKESRTDILADRQYLYYQAIDPTRVPLPEGDAWHIAHQSFLLSELVKIWDEAEYIWVNRKDMLREETVRDRVHSLTRYGDAKLFLGYLRMYEEKTGTPAHLLHEYAKSEQGLLYIFRWLTEGIDHPYLPEEKRTMQITIRSLGKEKVQVIRIIREISDWKLSLKEAVEIADKQLPYTAPTLVSPKAAEEYRKKLEEIGASFEITETVA